MCVFLIVTQFAAKTTSAYTPHYKCMDSVRKQNRSPIEDFCSYSSSKVHEISREIDQEPHRGFVLSEKRMETEGK